MLNNDSGAWDRIRAVEKREQLLYSCDTDTTHWQSFLAQPKAPTQLAS